MCGRGRVRRAAPSPGQSRFASPTFDHTLYREGQFTTLPRPAGSVILREMMRLGSLNLSSNLFLSPLAGYTNLPFRLALREIGGLDLATTDLVNARSLI